MLNPNALLKTLTAYIINDIIMLMCSNGCKPCILLLSLNTCPNLIKSHVPLFVQAIDICSNACRPCVSLPLHNLNKTFSHSLPPSHYLLCFSSLSPAILLLSLVLSFSLASHRPLSFSVLSLTILLSAANLFDRTSPHTLLSLSAFPLSTLKPKFQFLRFFSCMCDFFHELDFWMAINSGESIDLISLPFILFIEYEFVLFCF
jgi:hypothetical protein